MTLTADVEAKGFREAFERLREFHRWDMATGLRVEMGKLMRLVTRFTPPQTMGQGKKAVTRDIDRAVATLKPDYFDSKSLRSLVRKRDYGALKVIVSKFKGLSNSILEPFRPSQHEEQRNRRGRVSARKFPKYVTMDVEAVKAYKEKMKRHVGQAKGGWARALQALNVAGSAWYTKHIASGEFMDRLSNPILGYIQAINHSEWSKQGDEDRIIANAMGSRAVQMVAALHYAQRKAIQKARLA